MAAKIEIVMKKAEPMSWARLELPPPTPVSTNEKKAKECVQKKKRTESVPTVRELAQNNTRCISVLYTHTRAHTHFSFVFDLITTHQFSHQTLAPSHLPFADYRCSLKDARGVQECENCVSTVSQIIVVCFANWARQLLNIHSPIHRSMMGNIFQ